MTLKLNIPHTIYLRKEVKSFIKSRVYFYPNMSSVQYYNAEQVGQVLNWPMINGAIKEAFKAVSKTDHDSKEKGNTSFANQPPRTVTQCDTMHSKLLLTMPAFVGNYQVNSGQETESTRNTLACKLVTSFSGNSSRTPPLPNILAHILLFNSETGQLESIVEGTQITGWRTASASVVATEYLYFERCSVTGNTDTAKPINVAIIGCGTQGTSHALGMCSTYKVSNIYLWNRTGSKADALGEKLRAAFESVNVHVCPDPGAAVSEADVICVGTYSPSALVSLDMIKKDVVHINTVGAGQIHFGEVAQDIYDNAQVFVDSWANARAELKDLKATIVGEVGEVIKGSKQPNKKGITIFQSMGMAAQDATVVQSVVEAVKASEN